MTGKIEIPLDVSGGSKAEAQVANLERRVSELSKSMDAQNKKGAKGAKLAAGSYAALEKELKDNVAALKKMEIGSKAFTTQKAKVDKLTRSVSNAKRQMMTATKTATKFTSSVGAGVSQLGKLALGFVGLQQGIAAVVAELEKAKQVELNAALQSRNFEEALAAAGLNVSGAEISATRAAITEEAPKLGTTQVGFSNLLGVAISAGAKDLQEALAVSIKGLRATAGSAEAATPLVETALDLASLAGSTNFRGAIGQVAQTAGQVRATNPSEFATNAGPAVAAVTGQMQNIDALTTEQALEKVAVLTQLTKDRTGALASTKMTQYIATLDSFIPELSATLKDGSQSNLTQAQIDEFRAERSIAGREKLFRGNANLRGQFADGLREGKGKAQVVEFLEGGRAIELEKKAAKGITSIDEAGGAYDELVSGVEKNTRNLRAERRSVAGLEAFQSTTEVADRGQVRDILTRVISNVDLPGLDSLQGKIAQAQLTAANEAGKDPVAEVRQYIEALRDGTNSSFYQRTTNEQEKAFLQTQLDALDVLREIKTAVQKPPVVVKQPGPRVNPPVATAAP